MKEQEYLDKHISKILRLADETRSYFIKARQRLKKIAEMEIEKLHDDIDSLESEINRKRFQLEKLDATILARHFISNGYRKIPTPTIVPTFEGIGLPDRPGIYFVFNGGILMYVGQSNCIQRRARLGHGKIFETDLLSYLECPIDALNFVECFYIGIGQPWRNFNGLYANSTQTYFDRVRDNSINRLQAREVGE